MISPDFGGLPSKKNLINFVQNPENRNLHSNKEKQMQKYVLASFAMAAFTFPSLAVDSEWVTKITNPAGEWWFASPTNWSRTAAGEYPAAGDNVKLGDWKVAGTKIFLQEGDVVPAAEPSQSLLYLGIAYGYSSGIITLEVGTGAVVRVSGTNINNREHIRLGDDRGADGRLFVAGGAVDCNGIVVGGGKRTNAPTVAPGKGWLSIVAGGVVTNNGFLITSESGTSRVDIVNAAYRSSGNTGDWRLGSDAADATWRSPLTTSNAVVNVRNMNVHGTADVRMTDTQFDMLPQDWSEKTFPVNMTGAATQTNLIHLVNSSFVMFNPSWHDTAPNYSRLWDRWSKIGFQSKGYSEFVQENSYVTNSGIWFWPEQNAGNVYPVKPPRYVVKGGELYVYSGSNWGDEQSGYPNGAATHGICAFTNAPNSGTISFVDAPKVSIPRVNTNVLVSGTGQNYDARVFDVTAYRPHFEYVLTRKGHQPVEIREQESVLGMYSIVMKGGLQVIATNRLALYRHAKSKALTTAEEPQFRAPNVALWETGPFADNACEWGSTLKASAEVAKAVDLGDGVSSGWISLPRANTNRIYGARVMLKLAPQSKSLRDLVADMCTAGYAAEICEKNGYNVRIDLMKTQAMPDRADCGRLVFDFSEPQDAVAVRDNARVLTALVQKADIEVDRAGLAIIFR